MKTVIEPFRAKVIESIKFTTEEERETALKLAGYNLFHLKAEDVIIDLLTDSCTSAMSSEQWSRLMVGDESYAGCSSYFRFKDTVSKVLGFEHVLPVHQGRAAERILFGALVKPGQHVLSNTHFDTTRANIESNGAQAIDFPDSGNREFCGNIDLRAVKRFIDEHGRSSIPLSMITLTNNSAGGQPASLENILAYAALLKSHDIPLFIDAARFAENAWLIKRRERPELSVLDIVRQIFEVSDGCMMSAKKDGLSNMGGFIACREADLCDSLKQNLILTEGFPTYGGLSGRDLECIARGINEALEDEYLLYREKSTLYLAQRLNDAGVPLINPPGLHAVYIDAAKFLPHLEPRELPGQALVCALYLEAGIRACEIGTLMFGRRDLQSGAETTHSAELVRLALPRRVYSQSHYDYVIEAVCNVFDRRSFLKGLRIVQQPECLRHFSARMEPIENSFTHQSGVSGGVGNYEC